MRLSSTLTSVLLLFCLSWSSALLAKDPTKPGPLQVAIAHLEAAKTAKEPLISLRAGRRAVVNAKGGKQRKEAVIAIDQAIEAAEAGDTKTMNAKIASAIFDIKQRMNNAK